jgi:hypothetical protein
VLPVNNTRHNDPFRGAIAAQLIGNNDARFAPGGSQQPAKEMHRRESVPFGLHKDIEDDAGLCCSLGIK